MKYSGRNVQRLRRLIYTRDNGICALCGGTATFEDGHVDHITPRRIGGSNHPRNLQWSHAACNLRKGGGINNSRDGQETAPFPFSLPNGQW